MALVACVMKQRPLKVVRERNHGRAPQWSRWKCEICAEIVFVCTSIKGFGGNSPDSGLDTHKQHREQLVVVSGLRCKSI